MLAGSKAPKQEWLPGRSSAKQAKAGIAQWIEHSQDTVHMDYDPSPSVSTSGESERKGRGSNPLPGTPTLAGMGVRAERGQAYVDEKIPLRL